MAESRPCSFCALPDAIRNDALARWDQGERATALSRWLTSKGHTLTARNVEYCIKQQRHHEVKPNGADALGRIAELLASNGIDAADVARVKSVKLNKWQGMYAEVVSCEACHGTGGTEDDVCPECDGKQTRRVPRVVDMEGTAIVLTPSWDDGPKWPVVDRAAQAPVGAPLAKPKKNTGPWRTAVVLPDVQIGYRRDLDSAALDPFHDETAMAAALQVVQAANPDLVVHLGDFLDFAQFGTFEQEPGFALTVQPAIDRAHRFLVETQAAAPNARQVLLEGNHDRRLQKAIVRNAISAFGIRRAEAPDEWPVLSVPYLLRLDELQVEYVGGYPAGIYWLNDRLACIHGHKVRSAGNTAAAVVDDERISVVFGHVHRIERQHRTRRVRTGHRTSLAASPGCLCRLDGAVPSAKGSTDPLGRPIPTAENWQHGLAVITYQEGDAPFSLELVPIHDGSVCFRGEWMAA